MKLPITLKNKQRKTNLKFKFVKLLFRTSEKAHFYFLKKTPKKIILHASFKIVAQMSFWSLFLRSSLKKAIGHQKCHFGSFGSYCIKKNIDKNNICESIVLKAKTEHKFF